MFRQFVLQVSSRPRSDRHKETLLRDAGRNDRWLRDAVERILHARSDLATYEPEDAEVTDVDRVFGFSVSITLDSLTRYFRWKNRLGSGSESLANRSSFALRTRT